MSSLCSIKKTSTADCQRPEEHVVGDRVAVVVDVVVGEVLDDLSHLGCILTKDFEVSMPDSESGTR